ncbi:MAG: hypothetical protein V3W17_00920, partial [Desulfobacteria bacterium]
MKKSIGARTVAYPTPVWVVGTYDEQGRPNLMTAAWVGICCSKPPCAPQMHGRDHRHNFCTLQGFALLRAWKKASLLCNVLTSGSFPKDPRLKIGALYQM